MSMCSTYVMYTLSTTSPCAASCASTSFLVCSMCGYVAALWPGCLCNAFSLITRAAVGRLQWWQQIRNPREKYMLLEPKNTVKGQVSMEISVVEGRVYFQRTCMLCACTYYKAWAEAQILLKSWWVFMGRCLIVWESFHTKIGLHWGCDLE